MKKATINALERVTNLSDLSFVKLNDNNTKSDMGDVVKCMPQSASTVFVYSFKLNNCGVSERRCNLNFKKTNSVKFIEHFLHYWYHLEKNSIESEYTKLMKDASAAGYEARAEVVRARYDHAMKFLAPYNKVGDIPQTIRLLVLCIRNAKEELFPDKMRSDFGNVANTMDKLNALNPDEANADESRNTLLKELRANIGKYVYPHVWVKTEDGSILNHVPKCNARLAQDIYRIGQECRKMDSKDGVIKSFYADNAKLMREIVLACYEELQIK